MKNYTITVNGTAYEVTVEERGEGAAMPAAKPAHKAPAAPVRPAAPAANAVSGSAGSVEVKAGAAGKIVKIPVSVGQEVKKGDPVIVEEAMKMEIPIVAPQDGVVSSINVAVSDSVEAGAVVATLK